MEIYNSEKKVDIGLGLLTNPSKKKKKKHFSIKKTEDNINTENNDNCQEKTILIDELNDFFKNKTLDIKEYDDLMQSIINLQIKLIKYKNFLKKIDDL
tara:strand:- start:389 stop:682 length:294 start_codon:yes stop_codon:yes gene_type:complete